MSIILRFYNFIIPKTIIKSKYDGGLNTFIENIPNKTFQEDDFLVSIGFMGPGDVEWFCEELKRNGLYFENNRSYDFTVTNSFFGNLWEVNWLDRDMHHCWMKGTLPTHTNQVKLKFSEHKVLDEAILLNRWWNSLNDIWKNILYQNLKFDNYEDKSKRLYSLFSFGYVIAFIGDISNEDVEEISKMDSIWVNAMSSEELKELIDLTPISNLENLRSITLKNTNLRKLSGIEKLSNLEFIDIDGVFDNIEPISFLDKLKTLNLKSQNIATIIPIFDLKLEWLNINNGNITNNNEFDSYKKLNPNCVIYKTFN